MLVISRKPTESIVIGDDIEIVVLSSSKSRVQLGIKTPRKTRVLRGESYKALNSQLQEASNTSLEALDSITEVFQAETGELK